MQASTFTPARLIIYGGGVASMLASQLNLPLDARCLVHRWRRIMTILVVSCLVYDFVVAGITNYQEKMNKAVRVSSARKDFEDPMDFPDKKDKWANEAAHPSAFLSTKEAKPRLFPFPLGKAGGQALRGELWWESGGASHVGHFNKKEMPEIKAQMKAEAEAKAKKIQQKAEKRIQEYEANRAKWLKRLSHVKVLSAIIVISLFHRTIALCCLLALIYYVFFTELVSRFKPAEGDVIEKPLRRRKLPKDPGLAMTYIYEPTSTGVAVAGAMPTRAPSHRLMTSLDSRYAS